MLDFLRVSSTGISRLSRAGIPPGSATVLQRGLHVQPILTGCGRDDQRSTASRQLNVAAKSHNLQHNRSALLCRSSVVFRPLGRFINGGHYFNCLVLGPRLWRSEQFFQHKPGAVLNIYNRPRELRYSGYYLSYKESAYRIPSSKPPTVGPKMKCWLQFVTTPTADTPGTTLILHFDQRRYLLGNVAEGTQRATVQRKVGLIKVSDIFLTGKVGWDTTGGLLGMILTVADAASSSREQSKANTQDKKKKGNAKEGGKREKAWLNLHGGKNLTHLLATARRFIFRKGMPLRINEFRGGKEQRKSWEPTFQDEFVNVWDLVIEPETSNKSQRKRSHEEFSGDEVPLQKDKSVETEKSSQQEDIDLQMTQAVVSDMFDSDWRLDALVSKKISEVALPAAIFVRSADGKMENYAGPMPDEEDFDPDVDVFVRNPWPGALVDKLPSTTPAIGSVCYIIKGHPQRGKFDAKAALALGVQKGPDFAKLTKGNNVTTVAGAVVTPDMVMSPTREGSGFAIVELPTAAYVASLVSREEWSNMELMSGVQAIFWILGPGVVEDARLERFMHDHSELQHVVSSKDVCANYLALESPASAAIRLNMIDPDRFPIPKFSNVMDNPVQGKQPYEKAAPGLIFDIEPKFQRQGDGIITALDTVAVVKEAKANTAFTELAGKAKAEISTPEYQAKLDEKQKDIPSKDAEIVTLGTGSALPSKYRNVSATLLRVPGFGSYLLDAGENTLGQLKRVFGDETPEVLRDLKAIWISHLHADHHLGTTNVIKAWSQETAKHKDTKNNRLHLISHEGMTTWMKEYSEVEEIGYERVELMTVATNQRKFFKYDQTLTSNQQRESGISSIQACSVQHCHGAAAVVLNFANGFKVAYSGDCRPSNDFIAIGRGATLLIHEATFDDELQGDAIAKKHSTTAEALGVGRKMGARRILLTHFSQRYQKIPVMDDAEEKDQLALVAFDYMRVKVGDFGKAGAFRGALLELYKEEVKEIEEMGRAN